MSPGGTVGEEQRSLRRIRIALGWGFAAVVVPGLTIEIIHAYSHAPGIESLVDLLSLSYEQNLPTWYASMLLFSCAVLLARTALAASRARAAFRAHWWILSSGFLVMSFDEVAELHERLGGLFGGSGILYFDWVIPAAVVVGLLAIAFAPFVIRLPAASRRRFVIAGAVYLLGALAMELPLGWWTERAGEENVTYALLDFVEETLELAGASLFVLALWRHELPTREATA